MPSVSMGVGLSSGGPRSKAAVLFAQRAADFDAATLALANGAAISSWGSRVGSYAATQTGSNRPTYSATGWSDGGPCVSMVSASKQAMAVDALATLAASGKSWGVASLARRSGTAEQILVGFSAGGASPYQYQGIDVTASTPHFLNNGSKSAVGSTYPAYSDSDSLIVASYSAGTLTLWIDGYVQTFSIGTTNHAMTKAMIGSLPWSGTGGIHPSCWNGSLRRQVWYGRALANRDVAAIEQQIGALYTRRRRIAIYGDSRTMTAHWPTNLFAATPPPPYWHNLVSNAEAGWVSYGISGQTCQDVLAGLTTNGIAAKYVPGRPIVHLISCGCNNPYVLKNDGPTTLAAYKAIFASLRASNPNDYLVAFTIPYRNDWATSGSYDPLFDYASVIPYVNAAIRAQWPTFADALVDPVAGDARWTDPTSALYDGSGVHYSAAGDAAFAAAIPITALANAAALRASNIWLAS